MATELSRLLKKLIVDGASYRSLARDIDISAATVARMINGEGVRMSTLEKVAAYLDLPPGKVFRLALDDGESEPPLDEDSQLIMDMLALLPDAIRAHLMGVFADLIRGYLEFTKN